MSRSLRLLMFMLFLPLLSQVALSADKDEEEIRALIPKVLDAWCTLDIKKVDPYYAADANLAYFDLAPMKYANWQEYRTGVQKVFFDPNRSMAGKVNNDVSVHHQGNLAWATFTWGADLVSKQGMKSHVDGRWTMILEKRQGRWIIIHEHVSAPLPVK